MTKLNGTEKQIAWADEIRDRKLNGIIKDRFVMKEGINHIIDYAKENAKRYEVKNRTDWDDYKVELIVVEMATKIKKELENESSAAWFIENKDVDFCKKVNKIVDEKCEELGLE